ncbi:MAG: SHOCT domain-containing protein [Alphaproteobacteria bacterium]|nr:SHOCT domain-containing protein [Alphaproteobacteria bacterium]
MAELLILLIAVLCIVFLIFLIQIPIFIAKGRGLSGTDITTIIVLSWCGLFLGITWFVALIFSLIWAPKAIIDGCETCGNIIKQQDAADQIEKLYKLQKRGIITKKEFDAEKKKILSK